jgi:protein-disulfide isomerase
MLALIALCAVLAGCSKSGASFGADPFVGSWREPGKYAGVIITKSGNQYIIASADNGAPDGGSPFAATREGNILHTHNSLVGDATLVKDQLLYAGMAMQREGQAAPPGAPVPTPQAQTVAPPSPTTPGPAPVPADASEMKMGNSNARVTFIEYTSVACPSCAKYHNTTFDDFKRKYIDTGKVFYILREQITGNPALAGSGFLLARCAGPNNYFKVVDELFRAQDQIYQPGTEDLQPGAARAQFSRIAQEVGMNDGQLDACLTDQTAIASLNTRASQNQKLDAVTATPTFVVNGTKYEGGQTLAQLDGIIQPLLK